MGDVAVTEKPDVGTPVETIPGVQGGTSAIASAHAPFLYFENAPAFGYANGILRVTLTAFRDLPLSPTAVGSDIAIVAHLRMNIPAAQALKAAIDGALLLASPTPGPHDDDGPTPRPKPN